MRLSIAEYEQLSHRDVELEGHRVHYVDEGEGFPVVLVHGSPTTSALWRHQIPTLSKRFRVIALDVLGFGRSVAPEDGVSFSEQAKVLRALLDRLGIDRYSLVGHDWGGPISVACAVQRPEQVHEWVLVNTTIRPDFRPPWYWKVFTAPWTGELLLVHANLWGRNLGDMMKAASHPEVAAHYLTASTSTGNRRTFLRLERLEGYRELMEHVIDALPSMPQNVLILWGTHDAYFRDEYKELSTLLPESNIVMLEGGGHFPQEDAPDAVTTELDAFLRTPHEASSIEMVPSVDWFIYAFVRKEAVVSSQIEGTEATLIDLLEFEAQGEAVAEDADVQEVCNYLEALNFARAQLKSETGLPLSMRLLNEAHARLMRGVRGADKQPGEVRRSQNWIGGTRPGNAVFVPPPPQALIDALQAFEKYMHAKDELPALVRAGLLHVQFETIHPYLDGNGRIGRLLVTLLLGQWRLLTEPLLYLSLFFKRNREDYYRRLAAVRTNGDWEGWTRYFLEGVATIADEAVGSARDIFARVSSDREKALAAPASSVTAVRLFELLPEHPILTIANAMELVSTTRPTATKAITALVDVGVLTETSGKKRDRTFAYSAYLDLLRVGTDL